ncbi:Zinc finger protein ZFPM1 [Takifugu flavidus]|uniref:Zinc finger protein ZFPM1 n=1 Tax=Takifugu flavidus TaxID=433684 RepID=A0A5C6P9M0_9TELE|nr:Zinc finger protein ZFPM1 [Takifugu flavidus]
MEEGHSWSPVAVHHTCLHRPGGLSPGATLPPGGHPGRYDILRTLMMLRAAEDDPKVRVVCEDPDCWLGLLPLTCDASASNCSVSSRGGALFCKVSRALSPGEVLLASVMPPPGSSCSPPSVKEEPLYPAALHSDIQLLPQQAGMAAILATAVVNSEYSRRALWPLQCPPRPLGGSAARLVHLASVCRSKPRQKTCFSLVLRLSEDIFPCKDCGIWYRSERNLQAHLMYYCASRQKAPSAASSPPQDKPKESYPNERVCPFPQCNKSCPSASSLEIHMRTHSGKSPTCTGVAHIQPLPSRLSLGPVDGPAWPAGERPFVCLICLSAFTTKANCERHLKVHTDTLNGVCHGCGFVSTTRDILYSHLVTSHMVCQPGSHSEVYSPGPGPGLPKVPVSTGLGPGDSGVVLKCQVCGHNSDSPSQLQQHVRTHLEVRVPAERSPTPRQSTPSDHALLRLEERQVAVVPKPESSSPGANGSSATPRGCSPAEGHAPPLQIKEEPRSDDEGEEQRTEANGEKEEQEEEQDSGGEAEPAARSAKGGRLSPTSPVPSAYMFNPEAAILPQASEILAKMSEMVHSRLKQGQSVPQNSPAPNAFFPPGAAAPTAAATPPHAGATCFESGTTGRAPPPAGGPARRGVQQHAWRRASPGAAGSRAASASPSDSEPPAGGAESQRPADVKLETPTGRDGISSSSEGEGGGGSVGGGGRTSDGSQSPAGAGADESEDDPNRTFCQACNIRFSRHDNYTVHKRFYCASRHDPSNQRSLHVPKAAAPAAAFLPQPIRTRKRKKMYEIHMARTEALANAAAAAAAATASAPSPSVLV